MIVPAAVEEFAAAAAFVAAQSYRIHPVAPVAPAVAVAASEGAADPATVAGQSWQIHLVVVAVAPEEAVAEEVAEEVAASAVAADQS